jgi:hypothetical protein
MTRNNGKEPQRGLLSIAERRRGATAGDGILSMAGCLLDLREHIADLYKTISENTIFKANDEFVPVPIGFKNEDLVEELQEKIESLKVITASLETIIDGLEAKYKEAGVRPMGLVDLDNLINEVRGRPDEIARAISRRATEILQRNPTASLMSAWADETIQLLENSKAEAFAKSQKEMAGLIALKDSMAPDIALGGRIVEGYKHPNRILTPAMLDAATVPGVEKMGEEVL